MFNRMRMLITLSNVWFLSSLQIAYPFEHKIFTMSNIMNVVVIWLITHFS